MKLARIARKIYEIRGVKVMLDSDLAELYGVETKVLKRAVRRNVERFPSDFMFELSESEISRCQIGALKKGHGHNLKYLPFAFTEQGISMLSSVLNSQQAIQVNIVIVRAFVKMRASLEILSQRIEELEQKYDQNIMVLLARLPKLK